ncbi:MAG TPA: VOC family protein [Methylovirgula sp.]|jgi:catechol 2,3-dioxygenase-like lactoylglutathione lyase family enzyme|nr:VOC family protein [Methylovirgula sp.]
MSKAEAGNAREAKTSTIDMKFEAAILPVADIDRAKAFYDRLGWRLDADFARADGSRAVQLTPPGSPASIQLGAGLLLYLVVSDIEGARAELINRGVSVSDIFHLGPQGRVAGPDPERRSYSSFATFGDPDGNIWLLQEITQRLPGRTETKATFSSASELAAALRRAETAHGAHERRTGQADANWPQWYADYIIREQTGQELPS